MQAASGATVVGVSFWRTMSGHVVAWFLLLLVSAAIYAPFLNNPPVFDDLGFFTPDLLAQAAGTSPVLGWSLRWISYGSFGWTYALVGLDIPWFRLGNLLIHACVGIALYHFLGIVLRMAGGERPLRRANDAALIGALWFVAHPVAVYGVGYLVERSIAMAAWFSLLSLIALAHGVIERRRWSLACSALFFLLAVFSKEHAVALPAVAALIVILAGPAARRAKGELAALFVAYGLIALFVTLRVKGLLGAPYEPAAMRYFEHLARGGTRVDVDNAHLLSIQTQAGLFFDYLKIWLLPLPQWLAVDLRRPFATVFAGLGGVAGMAAFAAYPVVCWLLVRRGGLAAAAALGLMFPWLLFCVEFTVVRIQEPFVLYRSYLWMTGCALVPAVAAYAPGRVVRFALAAAAVLLLALGATGRLTSFSSEFALWNDAVAKQSDESLPGAWRAFANRGAMHGSAQRWPEALADLNRALHLYPDYASALVNRGNVHAALGRREEAMADFTRGHALARKNGLAQMAAYALARRGTLQWQSGSSLAALKDLRAAVQLDPRSANIRFQFGQYLLDSGYQREAAEQLGMACALGMNQACALQQSPQGRS